MAKRAGSLWVEQIWLSYVSATGVEWRITGSVVTAFIADSKPGSVWIESDNTIHWIGTDKYEYRAPFQGIHSDAAVRPGGIWVQGEFLYYSGGANSIRVHGDAAHQDGTSGGGHLDTGHLDVGHQDNHTDGSHGDTHTDSPHGDYHDDAHSDGAHGDAHADSHGDYHGDAGPFNGHGDCTIYTNGQVTAHSDATYPPGTITNCMFHDDVPHQDSHSDGAHGDSHGDYPHQDYGHADTHDDSSHGDIHNDAGHGDSAHVDHTDAGHLDVAHADQPQNMGA